MPNHVTNILRIVHKDFARVDQVLETIRGESDDEYAEKEELFIDFNRIEPMPKELNISAQLGVNVDSKLADQYDQNVKKFGYAHWYDWRHDYWGTKWNGYDQVMRDSNTIVFDTAWSSPHPIIQKLSTMFPDVEFSLEWADEDIGYNVGHVVYKNGSFQTIVDERGMCGEEKIKFACEIKGMDYDEYKASLEEW